MKYLLIIAVCFFSVFKTIAQESEQKKFIYEKISSYEDVSQQNLYKYSKRWVANLFQNSNFILRTDDLTSGEIIGVASTEIIENPNALYGPRMTIEFTFMINLKDNKSRIRFYDLTEVTPMGFKELVTSIDLEKQKSKEKTRVKWEKFSGLINNEFNQLINHYTSEMGKYISDEF